MRGEHMPSPEHEAVVAMLQAAPLTEAPSLEEQRANYDAMLSAAPIGDDVTVEPVTIEHIAADIVSVPSSSADRVILYFHGGGYVIGSNVAYRGFAGRLARATSSRVCVVNYRLAPEHPFPAALDDAVMAYSWLRQQGYAANRIVIAGDSAGGGLTLATLLKLRELAEPLPAGAVTLSPWSDLAGTGATLAPGAVDDPLVQGDAIGGMAGMYAPNDLTNPLASPLYGDYAGLPPLLIQVGGREVLLDDAVRVRDKARAAGVDVVYFEGDGLIHVWPVLAANAPESEAALSQIGEFVAAHT
nr:lipase/esterase [uncultured bacterium]